MQCLDSLKTCFLDIDVEPKRILRKKCGISMVGHGRKNGECGHLQTTRSIIWCHRCSRLWCILYNPVVDPIIFCRWAIRCNINMRSARVALKCFDGDDRVVGICWSNWVHPRKLSNTNLEPKRLMVCSLYWQMSFRFQGHMFHITCQLYMMRYTNPQNEGHLGSSS